MNIGGIVFQTSKSTLTRFDGFYRTIMETNVPIAKDSSGCIVIDRDPKHFRLILNYMRDGDVDLPETLKELKEVDKEVKYYLMDSLMERCHLALRKFDGKWADLSDKMKLNLIEYLDLRTKCSLRATARAEKALIDSRKHHISGVAIDGYYNVTIYVSYKKIKNETLSLPFRTKLNSALTYIFMYSDVERICMDRGSYMGIQDLSELEKMVPSQTIHLKGVFCRGVHNFRNIETLLRLSWNRVESIDFNCCDESASSDEKTSNGNAAYFVLRNDQDLELAENRLKERFQNVVITRQRDRMETLVQHSHLDNTPATKATPLSTSSSILTPSSSSNVFPALSLANGVVTSEPSNGEAATDEFVKSNVLSNNITSQLFFSVIVFFAFINDHKVIMKAHMWFLILFGAIPLAIFELVILTLIMTVIFDSNKILYSYDFIMDSCIIILIFASVLFNFACYIRTCHKLIKDVEKKEKALLPYSNQELLKEKPIHPII